MTRREKEIWNEAVMTTLREVYKYDGLIPSMEDREYMTRTIRIKLCYTRLNSEQNPERSVATESQ